MRAPPLSVMKQQSESTGYQHQTNCQWRREQTISTFQENCSSVVCPLAWVYRSRNTSPAATPRWDGGAPAGRVKEEIRGTLPGVSAATLSVKVLTSPECAVGKPFSFVKLNSGHRALKSEDGLMRRITGPGRIHHV